MNSDEEQTVKDILHRYYIKWINSCNFENAYWQKDSNTISWRRKEVLLGEIFNKYFFQTPYSILSKLIWLDTGGVRQLYHNIYNNKPSLSEVILDRLPQPERAQFREEILENMKKGILLDGVYGTHVSLCIYFKTEEASLNVLERIKTLCKGKKNWEASKYIDAYVKLNGDLSKLKPFLKIPSDKECYHFFNLAEHLRVEFPDLVRRRLTELMSLPKIADDDKLKAALKLASMGNPDGLAYVIDHTNNTRQSPTDSPERYSIVAQDTDFALRQLRKVRHFILEESEDKSHFWRDIRNMLVEWIFQLAGKSEKDLKKVVSFLEQAQKDFADHPHASSFTWFAEHCKEKLKESGVYPDDIREIKTLLNKVSALLEY